MSAMFSRVLQSLASVLSNVLPSIVTPLPVGSPEHATDLAAGDLDADTGQEADEHRARHEVGEEAETDEPGDHQQRRGHQRHQAGERDVLVGLRGGQARPVPRP